MFKCRECGCEFDKPFTYVERHGFTHGPFERWGECPHCGSCDYGDAYIVEREEAADDVWRLKAKLHGKE